MTDIAIVAARLGLYFTLAIVFGLPCFSLWTWRDGRQKPIVPLMRIVGIMALLALLLSLFQLVALAASMAEVALTAVDRPTIAMLLDSGAMAFAWKIRVALLCVLFAASIFAARKPGVYRGLSIAGGGIALATMAWFGHGAADEGAAGWLHLVADIAHLLAAGVWMGALVGLGWLLSWPQPGAASESASLCERALADFAGLGTLIVVTLVVTGLVNAWFLIGVDHLGGIADELYGRLLLLKLAAFGVMLILAASNRYRLTPALARVLGEGGSPTPSLARLRVSLLVETVMLALILGLVAWFGTLSPPVAG